MIAKTAPRRKALTYEEINQAVFAKTPPGTVLDLPLDKLHRRPSNRGGRPVEPADVAELAESLRVCGLTQAVTVRDISEEQELPVGHYELVQGERRYTAARVLQWDTIPALVVTLTEAAAAVRVNADNTNAQPLDPIQRALALRDAMARGVPEDQAAASVGAPKGAKNLLRLLDLPDSLQELVAAGRLSQKIALACVPYVKIPAVMAAVAKAVKANEWWVNHEDRYQYELQRILNQHTRPVDTKTKHDPGYQRGGPQTCAFAQDLLGADEKLTPEARASLNVVEIRVANKPTLLATNTKAWDARQQEARAAQKKHDEAKRRQAATTAAAAGQPANPDAEAAQDHSLVQKTERLALLWLRLLMAEALIPGDDRTRTVHRWLTNAAADMGSGITALEDWDIATATLLGTPITRVDQYARYATRNWDLVRLLIGDDDRHAAADQAECLRARLLLFPAWRNWGSLTSPPWDEDQAAASVLVQPYLLPEHYLNLPDDEIRTAAHWLGTAPALTVAADCWPTDINDAWRRARNETGYHRSMLRAWLDVHNKRQLQRQAAEWKITGSVFGEKLSEKLQTVLDMHTTTGLPIPKSLLAAAAPPKPAKAAGRRRKATATTDEDPA